MSTDRIANFIVEAKYDQMPDEAIAVAKKCILDCLGVMLAGSREPVGKIIREHVRELGGKPEASMIAGGFKTCAPQAALANGTMAHVLDYDDYSFSHVHHSAVLLPTVLALAEKMKASGKELLEAYIIGFEVGAKLGNLAGVRLLEEGWHPTAVIGTMGSAAASARLLKLNVPETKATLGIAASEAGGLKRNFGTAAKPFHAGKSASNGITAALLAKRGFSAFDSILEGPIGFFKMFTGQEYDLRSMADELGSPFENISGAYLKPYPTCGATHYSITAVLELIKEQQLRARDVSSVECRTSPLVHDVLIHHHPKTALEGKFSMEYCLAIALFDGEVSMRQLADEKVLDAKVQELIGRVKYTPFLEVPPGADPLLMPQSVTVKLKDGRQYTREIKHPKGHSENPMSWDEVCVKFRDCSRLSLPANKIERCIELVSKMESLNDATELFGAVSAAQ